MADGPCADGARSAEGDKTSVNDDSTGVCNLKTTSENGSRPAKVKMSFYIESISDVTSDKCESLSVAGPKNSSADRNKRVEYGPGQEEDCRKKRCTDRYDSSESSDSGVAVLSSCTDCSGSSGSDITEPGSPYSPSSSSSGCVSEGGGGEGAGGAGPSRPAWPWAAKRPRSDKCTNLEVLIASKLQTESSDPLATLEPAANYNNNILVNIEERKNNTQSSQHCRVRRPPPLAEMPSAQLPAPPLPPDCLSQISSIPKHIIHKAAHQQAAVKAMTGVDRSVDSKAREDKANLLKIQQGRITEYFKSQMKPSNGLKRDIAAWITRATDGKSRVAQNGITKAACEANENLEKYISYLSQTLNPKVLLSSNVVDKKFTDTSQKNVMEISEHLSKTNHPSLQKLEHEKKPLPGLNPIQNSKNTCRPLTVQKTDVNKISTEFGNKPQKEFKSRGTGTTKLNGKRRRTMEAKKSLAPKIIKTKTSQVAQQSVLNPDSTDSFNFNNCILANNAEGTNPVSISSNVLTNTPPNTSSNTNLSSIHDHMRHIFMKLPATEIKSSQPDLNKSISSEFKEVDRVSCFNPQAQVHNSSVTTSNSNEPRRTESIVNSFQTNSSVTNITVPQPTVMLTAIRIPQHNLQHQLTHSESPNGRTTAGHINITNPTKINGQFMLPMVQNINGAVVQIPNFVTKMGQNTVLPLSTQNIIQRTDNIVNQQTTQMFINGTILKINGPMHPNLPGLIAKQMTATSTTNVSYTVTQKNISTAMPTVMVSKPNFTMNLNHPMFVSSSGFILNPVGSVVTTQTNTGIPHVQQTFNGNMVLTTPVHSNVHINPNISNNISGLPMPPCSIPISPLKIGDLNRVFITPTRPPVPKMSLASEPVSKTAISSSKTNIVTSSFEKGSVQKVDINICNSTTKYSVPKLDSIVDNIVSQVAESVSRLPNLITCSKSDTLNTRSNINDKLEKSTIALSPRLSRDDSTDSIADELGASKADTSSLILDDSIDKSSPEAVSLDLTVSSETPSIDSPVTETSKDIDEDSCLTINTSIREEIISCQKSPILSQPKTIRFPVKKHIHNESRNRTSARSTASENKLCRWNDCTLCFEDSSDLLEHLQESHVNSQAGRETYTCLWQGCKVYNRPSCSRCWLERHVLSHGGNKLFRCIVDGCGQRFNTQLSLHRHVNSHFTEQGSNASSARKSLDNGAPKLIRRNGKKLRYRKQPWSARIFDFFDAGIMEGLQYRVVRSSEWRVGGTSGSMYQRERGPHCVTMAATVLARRLHPELEHHECLVSWTPKDVLPDEWLPERDFVPMKSVRITHLNPAARDALYSGFCSSYRHSPQQLTDLSQQAAEKTSPIKPINGICKTAIKKSPNSLHCHNNNAKTDSLNTNIANNDVSSKKVANGVHDSLSVSLTGAAKRKQGKRYTREAAFRCVM